MPKAARYTLRWSSEHQDYKLFAQNQPDPLLLGREETAWFVWLEAHSSFSFHGSTGSLSFQKERRSRGKDGYWYAYHRRGRHMVKQYVGSSRNLTIARLEAVAQALGGPTMLFRPTPPAPEPPEGWLQEAVERTTPVKERAEESLVHNAPVPRLRSSASHQRPLLLAKLRPPRLLSHLITRERLHILLDTGLQRKLTLVTAPAGYGKTTLVNQWSSTRCIPGRSGSFPPVAWVCLEPEDNDPIRFWRYVLAACQAFQQDLGWFSLAQLLAEPSSPFASPDLQSILITFLNEVTVLSCRGVLFLEDYHVITSSQIHETVAYLVDHLPASLHVVMLTRTLPPLPLIRWRARNDLLEVGATDLSFSPPETQYFLQQLLPDHASLFSASAIVGLQSRLEGWGVGLHLLTLALRGRSDPREVEQVLATFTGNERHIQDYLVTEVLSLQPGEVQTFLLQTSLLSRLTASLCEAVTGRGDSEQVLEQIASAGLFLQPIEGDEQWYRYHALFTQAMRAQAQHRLGPEVLRSCLSRASIWYEQQGMLADAVEAALQAPDFARAATLIEDFIGPQYWVQEYQTVQHWLSQLPEPVLHSSPALCFFSATMLTFSSASDQLTPATHTQVETLLLRAEQTWQETGHTALAGILLAFRALLAVRQAAIKEAAYLARQARAQLSEEQPTWQGICLGIVAEEERWLGQFNAARSDLLTVLSLFNATKNHAGKLVVVLLLAEVCTEQGALYQAAELYHTALAWAGEQQPDRAKALIGLAQLAYEWNELARATQLLQEVAQLLAPFPDESLQVQATLLQARVLRASGETEQAVRRLQALLVWTHSPPLLREILAWQARLELSRGNLPAVDLWVTSHRDPDEDLSRFHSEREELLMARWLLAQDQEQVALGLLEHWRAEAVTAGRTRSALESQVLMVLAHQRLKHRQEAQRMLREVIALAHREGYLRLFLDEGEELSSLLPTLISQVRKKPLHTYLQAILMAFDGERERQNKSNPQGPRIEELSPQEQNVLCLLVTGRSRQQIAEELFISINTVKTHVQRIYQKLHVTNRFEASEKARELHLH
jgi:LuxR family maltose regulon positive regulatory protein